METAQPVYTNIYQISTYRKDLSRLHFDDDPGIQEAASEGRPSVPSKFSRPIPISIFDLTYPSSSWEQVYAMLHGGFIEIKSNLRRKKLHNTNQCSNFLWSSFRGRDNVKGPINLEEINSHSILKTFFCKNKSVHIHISSIGVTRSVKETSWIFPALK